MDTTRAPSPEHAHTEDINDEASCRRFDLRGQGKCMTSESGSLFGQLLGLAERDCLLKSLLKDISVLLV